MYKLLTCIFIFLFTFTSSVNAGYFVKSESGLTVAGSIYSIQDSARKIYSWVEGEGYRGNTTYVDPISGEVYTSDAMLKDGAVDLATAATISGAFKIGGKVVSNVRTSKELSKITKKGGLYSDVRATNKGGEVHHLIADSVSEIPRKDAPSIWMTKSDHMQTESWGNSNVSKTFRATQKNLVKQGKNRDALTIGIKDVRSKFDSKYNKELLDAIDSAKNNQMINKMFKK